MPLVDLPLRLYKTETFVRGSVARQGYAYLEGGDNPSAVEEVVPRGPCPVVRARERYGWRTRPE